MIFDWVQIQLDSLAKQLAWEDLDQDDQRIYMREAQKYLAKHSSWMVEEGPLEKPKKIKNKKRKQ